MSALAAWWHQRGAREQRVLAAGGGVLCLLVLWLLGVEPLAAKAANAGRQLGAERATGAWLAGLAPATPPAPAPLADGETALGVLNESLRAAGLESALKRLAPSGDAAFELGLEGADWRAFAGWLQNLVETRGARVTAAHLEKTTTPGQVNGTLSLAFGRGSSEGR